jgi:hypothetical protein
MKFEIHFEFRASLRKFHDLNFWDATTNYCSSKEVVFSLKLSLILRRQVDRLALSGMKTRQ